MANQEKEHTHQHHHHHHHHYDDATKFKLRTLQWQKRRKKIEKYGFWILCAVAVIMFIAVLVVYKMK